VVPPAQQGQPSLDDLARAFSPLLEHWTKLENDKHGREMELEGRTHEREVDATARLSESQSADLRFIGDRVTLIALSILGITAYLFVAGRDATAMDFFKMVISLAIGLIGGYGIGRAQRQQRRPEDDDD
jgi:hypothetical protein